MTSVGKVVVFFFFLFFFVFFFKQKTAYEMCGRDWSSDVCSSDLVLSLRDKSHMNYDGIRLYSCPTYQMRMYRECRVCGISCLLWLRALTKSVSPICHRLDNHSTYVLMWYCIVLYCIVLCCVSISVVSLNPHRNELLY